MQESARFEGPSGTYNVTTITDGGDVRMSTMHKVSGGYVEYDYQAGRTRSIQVIGGNRDDDGGYGNIKPNNREK